LSSLLDLAERVVSRTRALGAEEVNATVSRGSHVTINRRGGRVEQATEATTRGLVVSLLANGRFTSNSTSDLREEALDAFLRRCVASAQYLEPDPDRAQADSDQCGRGASQEDLDQDDPAWYQRTADARAVFASELERSLNERSADDVVSQAVYCADGQAEVVRVMSNGFSDSNRGAWFAAGGEMTLKEGDKRPESSAYYAARYLDDLPSFDAISDEVVRRTRERLGAGPIASGTYPLILQNRVAGRLLGALAGPLSGAALHNRRSCFPDHLSKRIASKHLSIFDDPTRPRGLGSRPWDGDGRIARPRPILHEGELQNYYVGVYYGRKLGVDPTVGSRSNWVLGTGEQSWQTLARAYPKAILVTGFLGGNSNSTSGDFSFGIRGLLVEHGEVTQSLSEMNVSGNLTQIFHRLVAVANDPWTWSAVLSPTLIFEDVHFSGT
jgi:PmbA protein